MKTFHEIKMLLEANFFGEYAEIVNQKKFDPENPEVNVKGVGKYKLNKLKENVVKKMEEATRVAKDNDFEKLKELLNTKSILQHFINAIIDIETEMSLPAMKRKATILKKEAFVKKIQKNIIDDF